MIEIVWEDLYNLIKVWVEDVMMLRGDGVTNPATICALLHQSWYSKPRALTLYIHQQASSVHSRQSIQSPIPSCCTSICFPPSTTNLRQAYWISLYVDLF